MNAFLGWTTEHRAQLVPLVFGFVALYLLLPRDRKFLRPVAILVGLVGLGGLGFTLLPPGATLHGVLFYLFSGTAILAATATVTHHNPIYSALSFALVTLSVCGLFLLRGAQFLAAATVIIYAGAIVVTFLFIIMLARQSGNATYDRRAREPFLATLATFVLLGGLLFTIDEWATQRAAIRRPPFRRAAWHLRKRPEQVAAAWPGSSPFRRGPSSTPTAISCPAKRAGSADWAGRCSPIILSRLSWRGRCCWWRVSGPSPSHRGARRGNCEKMTSELTNYLIVGAVLFTLGALGFLTRRNLIVAFLSAEMMLLAVTLNLVAFSYEHATYEGQVFAAIVLTVAACEAGLALALVSALYRLRKTLDMSVWRDLGEPDVELPAEKAAPPRPATPQPYPRLTPAGRIPETAWPETPTHV